MHFGAIDAIRLKSAQAILTNLAQITLCGLPFGNLKQRQMVAFSAEVQVATFGDFERVFNGFGKLGEKGFHLFGTTHVIAVIGHAHACGVTKQFAGLDTKQNIL